MKILLTQKMTALKRTMNNLNMCSKTSHVDQLSKMTALAGPMNGQLKEVLLSQELSMYLKSLPSV